MALRRPKSRYEIEVHLGLLAIILLLLILNAVPNYVLYRARDSERGETVTRLRQAALAVARTDRLIRPHPLATEDLDSLRSTYHLKNLTLIPSVPKNDSREARRDWLREITRRYPPTEYPDLAQKLFGAGMQELSRIGEEEYYYLYPVTLGNQPYLLVLSINQPVLAYLDNARHTLMILLLGTLGVTGLIYLVVYRFIFRPFRRIREQAQAANRAVTSAEDDVEAVVTEYESMIRQLKKAQRELMAANEEITRRADALALFNSCLMESGLSGIVSFDRDGKVVAVNERAHQLLGVSKDSTAGRDYAGLLADWTDLTDSVAQVYAGEAAPGYREYNNSTGQTVGAALVDIRQPEYGFAGLLLMLSDLTEVCQLRSELENRKRLAALGEMSGGLAHQMRNSLGAIGGYATLLKKRLTSLESDPKPAESLLAETAEAENLISRFLSFSRPLEFTPEPVDLAELVSETVRAFKMHPDNAALTFQLHLGERQILIDGDALLLKQAVGNIIDNAIKASDSGGEIKITIDANDEWVTLSIQDRGCGLNDDDRDRIFTPFFSTRPSGTGLGLPLAAKIVDLHDGSISVDSAPGHGTIFRLKFNRITKTSPSPASGIASSV